MISNFYRTSCLRHYSYVYIMHLQVIFIIIIILNRRQNLSVLYAVVLISLNTIFSTRWFCRWQPKLLSYCCVMYNFCKKTNIIYLIYYIEAAMSDQGYFDLTHIAIIIFQVKTVTTAWHRVARKGIESGTTETGSVVLATYLRGFQDIEKTHA